MGNHIELAVCDAPAYRAKDYEFVRQCEYGKVVRQQLSGMVHILKETTLADEQSHLKLVGRLRNESSKHYTNVLNLTHFESQQMKAFCSSSMTVAALFEYSETSLETEVRTRQKKKIAFSEPDVQSILIMLVDAMMEVKMDRLRILPRNILVMQDKTLRLINPLLDYSEDISREAFTPPQMLNFPESKRHNYEKAVVWQIGMTMLSVMALKNCLDLYKTDELEQDTIESLLGRCSRQYSEALVSLIRSCLWFDPENRMQFKKLDRLARQYNDEPETIPAITISRLENMSQLQTPTLHNDSFVEPAEKQRSRPSITGSRKHTNFVIDAPPPPNSIMHHESNQDYSKRDPPRFTSPLQLQPTCSRKTSEASLDSEIHSSINSLNPHIRSTVFERESIGSTCKGMVSSNKLRNSNSIKNSSRVFPKAHDSLLRSSQHNPSKAQRVMQSHGKLTFPNGSYYEGNFREQHAEGFGVLYSKPSCPLYQGFWHNNKYEGDGILYNIHPEQLNTSFDYTDLTKLGRCWLYYRGTFLSGLRQGRGTSFLSNGQYFTGEFVNDTAEGPGQYHCLGGEVVSGEWRNNRLTIPIRSQVVPF